MNDKQKNEFKLAINFGANYHILKVKKAVPVVKPIQPFT